MRQPPLSMAAALAVTVLALAGCIGSGAEADRLPGVEASFDQATGGVVGVVLDESELPLSAARVALVEAAGTREVGATATDDAGVFSFDFVPPSAYLVTATKEGYEFVSRAIDVRAGGLVADVLLIVPAIPGDAPYHVTDSHRFIVSGTATSPLGATCVNAPVPGYESMIKTCNANIQCDPDECETHYGHCGAADGEWGAPWAHLGCDLSMDWETIIAELESQPTTATTGRGWSFTVLGPNAIRAGCTDHPTDCGQHAANVDPRGFRTVDYAPIVHWIDKQELTDRGIPEEDFCCDWVWRLFPGSCDLGPCDATQPNVGVMQDQVAAVHFTYFIRSYAPAGWSALADQ